MTKPLGQWKLPQPTDLQEDNEWVPIPRVARTIPFGYELDPEDDGILLLIEHELDMLMKAKKYLKQYSYREVANWLTRHAKHHPCLLYTSPSPRDGLLSRMPSSA